MVHTALFSATSGAEIAVHRFIVKTIKCRIMCPQHPPEFRLLNLS